MTLLLTLPGASKQQRCPATGRPPRSIGCWMHTTSPAPGILLVWVASGFPGSSWRSKSLRHKPPRHLARHLVLGERIETKTATRLHASRLHVSPSLMLGSASCPRRA
ncbi:hypothetical protein BU16DRAFT_18209 [Lophium mytilinum]|uniref:Uncharacterized protein n=1 Tax=Lophium mytilinum TaxID=390894 RepID=A0A6A6REB6_9PEZI|nr:hypothetical protein BU16DRAFT_18209 [Lophium mytilinum]